MHQVPVLATTAAAYRLVAREFATIVRLSWGVLFIVALVQFFLARSVLAHMASALASGDVVAAARIGRAPAWVAIKMAIEMAGTGIVAVAIHELALFADRKNGQYLHIAFGWREGVFVALGVALAAAMVPFATVAVSPFGEPASGLKPFLATVLFVVSLMVAVRLWLVLPIIVVERRFDLASAWSLGRGRFWTLLALALFAAVPIGVVGLVIDSLLPSFDSLMDAITSPRNPRPHVAQAITAVGRAQKWLALRVLLDFLTTLV